MEMRSVFRLSVVLVAGLLWFGCGVGQEGDWQADDSTPADTLASSEDGLSRTLLVDVSGDGLGDRVVITPANEFKVSIAVPPPATRFWYPPTYGPETVWVKHGGPELTVYQINFFDLNLDKKKDLIVQGFDNKFWVSISTGTSFKPPANWVSHGGSFVVGQAQYPDVNGDNRPDLVFQALNNYFWVSINTGTGFTGPAVWVTHGGSFVNGKAQYADLNGDRKKDLILQGTDNRFWVSLSTGTGFRAPANWVSHGGNGYAYYSDLNSDGKADLTFYAWATRQNWISYSTGTSFTAPQLRKTCKFYQNKLWVGASGQCHTITDWSSNVVDWAGKDPATCKGRGEYGNTGFCGHREYFEYAIYGG